MYLYIYTVYIFCDVIIVIYIGVCSEWKAILGFSLIACWRIIKYLQCQQLIKGFKQNRLYKTHFSLLLLHSCLSLFLCPSRLFSLEKPSILGGSGSVVVSSSKQAQLSMQQLQQRAATIPPMVSLPSSLLHYPSSSAPLARPRDWERLRHRAPPRHVSPDHALTQWTGNKKKIPIDFGQNPVIWSDSNQEWFSLLPPFPLKMKWWQADLLYRHGFSALGWFDFVWLNDYYLYDYC